MARRIRRGVVAPKRAPDTIFVSPRTPFAASLRSVDKRLKKSRSVNILGLGRAIHTVVQIAAALRTRGYEVDLRTRLFSAVDELIDEDEGTAEMVERDVSAVELSVRYPRRATSEASKSV